MKSPFLSLNARDYIRSAIVAAGTAIGMTVLPILQSGNVPTLAQLKTAGISGIAAAVTYILKNYFTNSQDKIAKAETPVLNDLQTYKKEVANEKNS